MDIFGNLLMGLSVTFEMQNVLYCFVGVLLGTLIGVLPGLGPVATIAMLLPLTYGLHPTSALIMLAGIFYGAQYGGSTTAILINVPGEATSVVTTLDGYQMAKKGRSGLALATAAISSFAAGTVATLLLSLFSPLLAGFALAFGPAEYFSLMVLGLVASVVLASGSLLKAFGMILVGLLLGLIGQDVNSGQTRFTLGYPELFDGLGLIIVAMGLFGVCDIVKTLEQPHGARSVVTKQVAGLIPAVADLKRMVAPTARGTMIGSLLGVLPGGGALLAPFAAYAVEKRVSRTPEKFGQGALEGVAAPESANNAGAQMSFVPMLTLGIPSNTVMALMIGALIMQGIVPGPQVITERPDLFWGLVASMWLGNLMLLVLNLPLISLWVRLLTIPYSVLFPAILVFCSIGVLSLNSAPFEVGLLGVFTVVGYMLGKFDCEPAPLLLGFILGPMMEEYLRRSLSVAHGDWSVFLSRPISATLLIISALVLLPLVLAPFRATRQIAFRDSSETGTS